MTGTVRARESAGTSYRSPRTPRERVLCSLFAEAADRDRVGIDDDFFDIGGDSRSVVDLIESIRDTLGLDIALGTVYEHPTVGGLAGRCAVSAEAGTALDVLLPLRTTGTEPPLFCVHPGTGLSWGYAGLLSHLRGRPLYGLQSRALSGGALPRSVAEMADDYVQQIRKVRPHGPYHLLGWSFGGRVAFEAAVRLQRAGEDVATLALLDSAPPPKERRAFPADGESDGFVLENAIRRYFLVMLGELDDEAESPGATDRPPDAGELDLEALRGELAAAGSPYGFLGEDTFRRMFEAHRRHYVLSRQYVPGERFNGPMAYFSAIQGEQNGRRGENWQPFVHGPVTEYPVDCTHLEMTRPAPLKRVAGVLAGLLAEH
ncbi:alpha/beta fold hydrolase [Streptomyces varsoviensis]|uniref:alpha/beta fold hydrolase n=1 Tax=Streptomyces varsoviensis TaxID=67373 RepID=UPI0033E43BA6